MRYRRAVERLRTLADACEMTRWTPLGEPFLREAHVFGELLEGADPLGRISVVFVLDLPPQEVVWETHPWGTEWLVDVLRLNRGGFSYCWRSRLDPVWNHVIRDPVRFWSLDGPDEAVFAALAERRFDRLVRAAPAPGAARAQLAAELRGALDHLRAVHDSYWEYEWRSEHRGLGRHPEHHLWEAVQGFLSLLDAARAAPADPPESRPGRPAGDGAGGPEVPAPRPAGLQVKFSSEMARRSHPR